MSIIFLLIIFCGLVLLISCSCDYLSDDCQLSERTKIANKLTSNTAEKLQKKYQLQIQGRGSRCDINELQEFLAMVFRLDRSISKNEARTVIIDCLEEYLNDVNNSTEIKPYLANGHFTENNLGITIFIYDSDGNDIFYPQLGLIEFRDNEITYITYDPESKHCGYKTVETETYEEACAILGRKPLD